ncbi:MAG: HAD-IG family 5'-nucleotidase, partial [Planctomycetota bacterium]
MNDSGSSDSSRSSKKRARRRSRTKGGSDAASGSPRSKKSGSRKSASKKSRTAKTAARGPGGDEEKSGAGAQSKGQPGKGKKRSSSTKPKGGPRSRRRRRRSGRSKSAAPLAAVPRSATPWWYELVLATTRSQLVDPRRSIYTNRTLRFDRVEAIGFDFDHTLAVYNCENLDGLAMQLVIDRLIKEEKIPARCFDHLPDASFARKGLLVDKVEGTVVKIDRYGHVVQAYRGDTKLSPKEKRELYGETDVIPHVTQGDRYVQVDTAFAKPEVLIFASVAPHLDGKDRRELWQKVRDHTDRVHRDGSLKEVIVANPLDYVEPDPHTVAMLRALREGGKKLFLLTNSEWEYTRAMMNPTLGLGEDPDDLGWIDLFDMVVAHSRKPKYFASRKRQKAEVIDTFGASETPVLVGGNYVDLEKRFGTSGPDVLYVGDHIYGDLITSKRQQSWRTMLIISKLLLQLRAQEQAMLPAHIRCIVDLRCLPLDNDSKYNSTIYLIVETVRTNPDPMEL